MKPILVKRALSAVVLAVTVVVLTTGVSPAFAGSGVWWGVTSGSWPSTLPEGGNGTIVVTAQDRGYVGVDGTVAPVVVRDVLPAGLTASAIEGVAGEKSPRVRSRGTLKCSYSKHEGVCAFEGPVLLPFEQLEVRIKVAVAAGASGANRVSVTGGGAAKESTFSRPVRVGEEEPRFGVEDYELIAEEEGGATVHQAGEHPFQLTSVLALNTSTLAASAEEQLPAAMARDLVFQTPPGLIGNPTPMPQCTNAQFNRVSLVNGEEHDECPPQAAVGVATVTYNVPGSLRLTSSTVPLFNLTPLQGEPARFGFEVIGTQTILDTAVRTGGDYGVTVSVHNIPETIGFLVSKVTFWGVPGNPVHDSTRGWACLAGNKSCSNVDSNQPPPFLSLPTACTGPMPTSVQADSWAEPKPAHPTSPPLFGEYTMGGLDGCNRLQFNPEIGVAPDVPDASMPTGLEVLVHVSQTAALDAEGLAESALRDTTVTLPEGVAVNPGGADGLMACGEGQVGYRGEALGGSAQLLFTPVVGSPFCPDAAKIGTVVIETPLLPHALKGAVYLASQNQNPFGSLLAMYLVAEEPVSGTLLKLAGEVSLNEATGQLVSTFRDTPELPFENLRLHFFGESRAPLGTPALCGAYTTGAVFAPWSGNPASHVGSTFNITSGPSGAPCPNAPGDRSPKSLPFAPSLAAGSTNIQAGAFTPFTTTMSREDGNQDLQSLQLHMPPGLSGTLSSVELCPEPQASQGTCGPNSLIGETTVSVGLGDSPYTVTGGKVYITGPYEGAPFGLSIVNPAKAGPFDLESTPKNHPACDCLVVRAKIEVDPATAALTIASDDTGPYKIPTMIEGIPLQIKHVNVTIDRPGFTFNPTNCEPTAITGALHSTQGATGNLNVPFQVANCATLGFKPQFSASTAGKTSRKNGASLHVRLTYPKAPSGSQANIRYVKVDLPRQLPSRLGTLQKACTDKVFDVNPAGCPAASRIGTATAITPLLPVSLTGPVYFVSHAAAKFPDLVIVLQGYGVTVDLRGETFIAKNGQTSTTFRTIPDAPVGLFELNLPQGPFSALAAPYGVCKTKLIMPTSMIAQNGATFKQSTRIKASGCPKAKKKARKANGKRKQ
ncbi:MAG TPA: hypothetical protein VHS55_05850 [Solirubrobacteraceae bacterium]|jgi:hypothetical protein|nr:hypothetical protein [Solirubrobacteraceae bacterium]